MSAITVCFTEPTSETMQPGLSAGAMRLGGRAAGADRRADDHQVGVLAPRRRGRCRNGRRASACWRVPPSPALRVAATIDLASPRLRASSAIEPPIRPMPISAILSNMRLGLSSCAGDEAGERAATGFTSASVPMVMRRMLGQAVARDHARDQPVIHQPVVGARRALLATPKPTSTKLPTLGSGLGRACASSAPSQGSQMSLLVRLASVWAMSSSAAMPATWAGRVDVERLAQAAHHVDDAGGPYSSRAQRRQAVDLGEGPGHHDVLGLVDQLDARS